MMIKVERVSKDELAELAILYEQLIGSKPDVDAMERTFSDMQDTKGYYVLGAKYDGKLAGSAMGIVCYNMAAGCKPFMVVEAVIVDDKYRHKGIGKNLMQELEKIALQNKCWYIILVSGGSRTEAHKMYMAEGYIEDVKGFRKILS